ncbi:DUF5123 domain-containing protein [Formosa sp. 4Alg 33]|uniref:DUF5123 domain-containing protein n=1 Tax=Formosa sp. 4Alg 33 TaxID=3382189 RepID=UPI003D9C2EDC
MNTKYIYNSVLVFATLLVAFASCTPHEDLIEELDISREFAPVELSSIIRNQTNVELNWTTEEEIIEYYVVEASKDSLLFDNIVSTTEVAPNQVPYTLPLEGETLYSIRVKAISNRGLDESTYAVTTARTLTQQLFLAQEDGDVLATEVMLRWVPNSAVTKIVLQPGNIAHELTAQEITDGIAVISNLDSETEYTAQLLDNTVVRGNITFTTGIDLGDGILVTPEEDLFQVIADADAGAIIILDGDYTAQIGTIEIDKPITIQGLKSFDKPKLKVSFSVVTGATDISLIDLDLTGDVGTELTDVVRYSDVGNFESLQIKGCNIHTYNRSFVAGNETGAILNNLIIDDCIVTNVITSGGDFIDFRNSDVLNISITNSTFNNCATSRDFLRIDAAGNSNNTGKTCNILLENCTLYGISNTSSNRIFYVRFVSNDITSRNNLITDTAVEGYSDNSATDETITFDNNNYFNAPTLYDESVARYDNTNTYETLDPGFEDAASGNFKVTTQTLIDKNIGDPRWLQ